MLPLRPADLEEVERLTRSLDHTKDLAIRAAAPLCQPQQHADRHEHNLLDKTLARANELTSRAHHMLAKAPAAMRREPALRDAENAVKQLAFVTESARDAIAQASSARAAAPRPVAKQHLEPLTPWTAIFGPADDSSDENAEASPWRALFELDNCRRSPRREAARPAAAAAAAADSSNLSILAPRPTLELELHQSSRLGDNGALGDSAFHEAARAREQAAVSRSAEQLEEDARSSLACVRALTRRLDDVLIEAVWGFEASHVDELARLEDDARTAARAAREALASALSASRQQEQLQQRPGGAATAMLSEVAAAATCNVASQADSAGLLPELQRELEAEIARFGDLVHLAHHSIAQTKAAGPGAEREAAREGGLAGAEADGGRGDAAGIGRATGERRRTTAADSGATVGGPQAGDASAASPERPLSTPSRAHLPVGACGNGERGDAAQTPSSVTVSRTSATPPPRLQQELERQRREEAAATNERLLAENASAIEALSSEVTELGTLFDEVAQMVADDGSRVGEIASGLELAASRTRAARDELLKAANRADGGCAIS